jgi:hypothetical protein
VPEAAMVSVVEVPGRIQIAGGCVTIAAIVQGAVVGMKVAATAMTGMTTAKSAMVNART